MAILFRKIQKFQTSGVMGAADTNAVSNTWMPFNSDRMLDENSLSEAMIHDNNKGILVDGFKYNKKKDGYMKAYSLNPNSMYELGIKTDVPITIDGVNYNPGYLKFNYNTKTAKSITLSASTADKGHIIGALHFIGKASGN